MGGAGWHWWIAANQETKNWILSKLLYVTRTHYNLYLPAVCEKNQILSLLLQPITLKICISIV